ncbi:MAG: tetratricopeptide repeat protein, partial [Gammaproteobacteria bacterium]
FIDPEEVVTTTAEVRARSGIAYELARALSRISTLKVVSNQAVAGMLGEADIAQIRRRLEVNYLIEGEASRDALAISLVNTLRGKTLWTENFDATRDPLFEAVGAITRRVARTLELPLPQGFPEQRVPEAAYLAYLKGRAELRKPGTEHARTAAREFFDDAIAIAPQFGEAYAGLCEAHINDYVATASASDFESAERYCHRALTLDPGNHEVHIALGSLLRSSGQYERALESYRTVLAAAPYNVEALRGMGDTYAEMGLAEKAEQQYKLLIEIEPGFWANYQNLGNLYFNIGRFTEAAENYEIQASLVRDRTRVINNLAAAHFLAEDFDRAVDAWKRALEIEPEAVTYANVGSATSATRSYSWRSSQSRPKCTSRPF